MQIFDNGVFVSCDEDCRTFRTLVEDGGRILFAGDGLPEAYRGAPDRTDLQGRTVVPSFADTHLHFSSFALFQATLDVRDADSIDDLTERIRSYERTATDRIVLGFGVSAHTLREKRLPCREDLDRAATRPTLLVKYDGHAAVGNSALLGRLPADILEDPGCDARTGWLLQNAFYKGVNRITKSVSLARVLANLSGAAAGLGRLGIDLIHTAEGVGFPLDLDVDLVRFAGNGLPLSVRVFFQTLDVSKATRRKLPRIGGCFATALDGCFGSEDAALLAPYAHRPADRGVLYYPQETVNAFVQTAHRAGLQIALHAIGDAAVEQALQAFAAALADAPRPDHRHIIIHADLMSPNQIDRAAAMGLYLAVQPAFLAWNQEPMAYLERILGRRAEGLIPLRSMRRRGIVVAGGSDAPCTLPDPIASIHAACNHPNPDERLTPQEALQMHTSWAARLSFDENDRGTLAAGKRADFVVLDRNPLAIPPETIRETGIVSVYRGGRPAEFAVSGPAALCLAAGGSLLRRKG